MDFSPNALEPESTLFPATTERLQADHDLTELLAQAQRRIMAGPVIPALDFAKFHAELESFTFAQGMDTASLSGWVVEQMVHGIVHVTHPRYLGLFNPAPSFAAQTADRIAAAFNPQLASATTSPAAVAIEAHVIRAVAQRAGMTATSAGHFTSGGSEANYTALLCALTRANPAFADVGTRAFGGPPVFYVSADCHLAWVKIAHQAGIGRQAVRLIATDGTGRMSMQALRDAMQADIGAGCGPVMIAATAGTTNAGMIDPLEPCAAAAREAGIWYHVDAAWGGALIASPAHRHVLAGMETADSITIDAHKWFATTMGCGMFFTSDAAALSACFNVAASFMPSAATVDPYLTSAQWSRRFNGLRLFMSLGVAGWGGHAAHVEHSIRRTQQLAQELLERGWKIANQSPVAVACIEPPAGAAPVREIVARVLASGRAWLSVARFEGRDVIRACVTHGETSDADISTVVEALVASAGTSEPMG